MTDKPLVRLQASSDRAKAKRQRAELMQSGTVESYVTIAKLKDGGYHAVSQGLSPDAIADALLAVTMALEHHLTEETTVKLRPKGIGETMNLGEGDYAGPARKDREVTTDAAGVLVPPEGENFIRCGECDTPGWFITHRNVDDAAARYVCSKCGNEVKMIRVTHREGTA